jgi:hypothetical protein
MKNFKIKNKKNALLIACYQVAIAGYLVGVSAVNAGCNQLGGLLQTPTSLTDTADLDADESLGLVAEEAGEGASLAQAAGNAPYGLKVNPLPANKDTAVYGIFDIPR